jgi:hypothetical protein
MAGILGGFMDSMNGAGPLGGRATNWLQENPYTALLLGMGLLSGRDTADAFGKGAQGLLGGSQYDTERKTLAEQQKEKAAQKAAIDGLFTGHWGKGLAGAQPTVVAPPGTRDLFKAFPGQAVDFAMKQLMPTPEAPYTLGPDEKRFVGGKEVASNPKAPPGTFRPLTDPAERARLGIPPTDQTPYQIGPDNKVYEVGGGGITNNILPGEKAWDTASAGLFAKRYDTLITQADKANEMLSLYDLASAGLDSGVRTGALGEAEQEVRKLGLALGIGNAETVAGGELISAVQNRLALIMRNPDSGMGMPGAVSDRDLKFLKESQIGLDRSPQGNKVMLEAFKRLEQRKIEVAALADKYIAEKGRLDAGFNAAVREFAKANPLFADMTNPAAGGAAPAAVPPGVVPYTDFFK